jgi:hypothetical protein
VFRQRAEAISTFQTVPLSGTGQPIEMRRVALMLRLGDSILSRYQPFQLLKLAQSRAEIDEN